MPPNDTICVYVARHGRTVLNATNSFRGNANPALDDVGIKQAHTLANLFKPIDISHIFCSDKVRAELARLARNGWEVADVPAAERARMIAAIDALDASFQEDRDANF